MMAAELLFKGGIWVTKEGFHLARIEGEPAGASSMNPNRLNLFMNALSRLGQPEALVIFGPGEAKLQLKERLSRSKPLSERIVGIDTTDKLTDPRIVARVREHYGIER